jgi:hypothetical protein
MRRRRSCRWRRSSRRSDGRSTRHEARPLSGVSETIALAPRLEYGAKSFDVFRFKFVSQSPCLSKGSTRMGRPRRGAFASAPFQERIVGCVLTAIPSLRKPPCCATMWPTGWAGGGIHACSHLDFDLGGRRAVAVAGWGLAAPKPEAVFADKSPSAIPVDVELVIAVDVCPIQWIQKSTRCSEKVTSSG